MATTLKPSNTILKSSPTVRLDDALSAYLDTQETLIEEKRRKVDAQSQNKLNSMDILAQQKRAAIDWRTAVITASDVIDADTIREFGRLQFPKGERRDLDTFENRKNGKLPTLTPNQQKNQFKAASEILGKREKDVTLSDIADLGDAARSQLVDTIFQGQSNTFDDGTTVGPKQPVFEGQQPGEALISYRVLPGQAKGRPIIEAFNAITGESLQDSVNTQQTNANFFGDFNRGELVSKGIANPRDEIGLAQGIKEGLLGFSIKGFGVNLGEQIFNFADIVSSLGNGLGAPLLAPPPPRSIRTTLGQIRPNFAPQGLSPDFGKLRQAVDEVILSDVTHAQRQLGRRQAASLENQRQDLNKRTKGLPLDEQIGDTIFGGTDRMIDTVAGILDRPAELNDKVFTTLSSVFQAAGVGRAFGLSVVSKLAHKQGITTAKGLKEFAAQPHIKEIQRAAARSTGLPFIAGSEGTSSGNTVFERIMNTPFDELAKQSPYFQTLVDNKVSKEDARLNLAYKGNILTTLTVGAGAALISKGVGIHKIESTLFLPGSALAKETKKLSTAASDNIIKKLLNKTRDTVKKGLTKTTPSANAGIRKRAAIGVGNLTKAATRGTISAGKVTSGAALYVGKRAGQEAIEEGPQSGLGALVSNLAIAGFADSDQEVGQGVAEQTAEGGLLGAFSAGIVSGPRGVGTLTKGTAKTVNDKVVVPAAKKVKKVAQTRLNAQSQKRITELVNTNDADLTQDQLQAQSVELTERSIDQENQIIDKIASTETEPTQDELDNLAVGIEKAQQRQAKLQTESDQKINESALKLANLKADSVQDDGTPTLGTQEITGITNDVANAIIHGSQEINDDTVDQIINNDTIPEAAKERLVKARDIRIELNRLKTASEVSKEVLGDQVNSAGKRGLDSHLKQISFAIASGAKPLVKAAHQQLKTFLESQQDKLDKILPLKQGESAVYGSLGEVFEVADSPGGLAAKNRFIDKNLRPEIEAITDALDFITEDVNNKFGEDTVNVNRTPKEATAEELEGLSLDRNDSSTTDQAPVKETTSEVVTTSSSEPITTDAVAPQDTNTTISADAKVSKDTTTANEISSPAIPDSPTSTVIADPIEQAQRRLNTAITDLAEFNKTLPKNGKIESSKVLRSRITSATRKGTKVTQEHIDNITQEINDLVIAKKEQIVKATTKEVDDATAAVHKKTIGDLVQAIESNGGKVVADLKQEPSNLIPQLQSELLNTAEQNDVNFDPLGFLEDDAKQELEPNSLKFEGTAPIDIAVDLDEDIAITANKKTTIDLINDLINKLDATVNVATLVVKAKLELLRKNTSLTINERSAQFKALKKEAITALKSQNSNPHIISNDQINNMFDEEYQKAALSVFDSIRLLASIPLQGLHAIKARQDLLESFANGTFEPSNIPSFVYSFYQTYGFPSVQHSIINGRIDPQSDKFVKVEEDKQGFNKKTKKSFTVAKDTDRAKDLKSLDLSVSPVGKKPKSVFAIVPDIVTLIFLDDDVRAEMISNANLLVEDDIENAKTINAGIKTAVEKVIVFVQNANNQFTRLLKDPARRRDIDADLLTLLVDAETGQIAENVKSAIAIALYNFMGTQARSGTLFQDSSALGRILQYPNGTNASDAAVSELFDKGGLRANIEPQLGNVILRALNFSANADIEGTFDDRMALAMGKMALTIGIEMGLLKTSAIPSEAMQAFGPNPSKAPSGNAATIFVRVANTTKTQSDGTSKVIVTEDVANIMENVKDYPNIIPNIFNMASGKVFPTNDPNPKAPSKMRRTINNVSKKMKEYTVSAQKQAFEPSKEMFEKGVLALSSASFLRMAGVKDPAGINIEGRDAQIAANDTIEREYNDMLEFMSRRKIDAPFYFSYFIGKNLRAFIKGVINYQSSKMHRFVFRAKSWNVEINFNKKDHVKALSLGLAQAFGRNIDNNTHDESVDWLHENVIDTKGVLNETYAEAVKVLQDGTTKEGQYTEEQEQAIEKAVSEGGEGIHTLLGLITLADYHQARYIDNKSSFETALPRETDGITNGVISGLLQMPPPIDQTKKLVERGGVFIEGQYKSVAQFKSNPQNRDNYQATAVENHNQQTKFKEEFENFKDDISNKKRNDIDNVEIWNLQRAISDMVRGTAIQFGKVSKTQALNVLAAMDLSVGSILEILNDLKDEFLVTKNGRDMFKHPLMIFAYGASIARIMKEFGSSALDNFKAELVANAPINDKLFDATAELFENIKNLDEFNKENEVTLKQLQRFQELHKAAETLFPGLNIPTNRAQMLEFTFPVESGKKYTKLVAASYGVSLSRSFDILLGDFLESREWVTNALRVINEIYIHKYNERISQKVEAKGNLPLSKAETDAVSTELRDEGFLPGFAHATSEDMKTFRDSQEVLKFKSETVDGQEGKVQQLYNFNKGDGVPQTRYKFNNGKLDKGTVVTAQSSSSQIKTRIPTNNSGVSGPVNATQGTDGNVNGWLMGQTQAIMNIWDAQVDGILSINDGTSKANGRFGEVLKGWSMFTAVQDTLVRVTDAISNDKALIAKVAEGLLEPQDETADASTVNRSIVYENFVEGYAEVAKTLVERRKEIFNNSKLVIGHFANEGSEVSPNSPKTPTVNQVVNETVESVKNTNLDNKDDSTRGSHAADFVFDDLTNTTAIPLTAENVVEVFDELEGKGSNNITDSHKAYLRDFVTGLVKPAIRTLENVILTTGDTTGETRGAIKGDQIYVGTSSGNVHNAGELSGQEVMAHEYAHMIWEFAITYAPFARRALSKIFNKAAREFANMANPEEIFIPRDSDGKLIFMVNEKAERAAALKRFEHIFKNKKTFLHEFAAFGLTNESFIKALAEIDNTPDKVIYEGGIFKRLATLFAQITDWIAGKFYGTDKSANLAEALQDLSVKATNISKANQVRSRAYAESVDWLNDKVSGTFGSAFDYVWKEYVDYIAEKNKTLPSNPTKLQLAVQLAVRLPIDIHAIGTRQYVKSMLFKNNQLRVGFLESLVREIAGPSIRELPWHVLLRLSKKIVDGNREHVAASVAQQMQENYHRKLTDNEWKAITYIAFKTHLSTLFDERDPDKLLQLVKHESVRQQRMQRIEVELEQFGSNTDYYIKQARNLAHAMIHGVPQMGGIKINPYMIANVIGTNRTKNGSMVQAEKLIAEYTTLQALDMTAPDARDMFVKVYEEEFSANRETNGITYSLDLYNFFHEDSIAKVHKGDKSRMWYGFVDESYDINVNIRIAPTSEESLMRQHGFTLKEPFEKDFLDTTSPDLSIYVANANHLNKYVSGIFSSTNYELGNLNKATSFRQAEVETSKYSTKIVNLKRLDKNIQRRLNSQNLVLNPNKNYLIPDTNLLGEVTAYRYALREIDKVQIMGKEDRAFKVMGRMMASIEDQVNSPAINHEIVTTAKQDFDRYSNKDTIGYVTIGPDAPIKENREIYRLMPESMKQSIKDIWGSDSMQIQKSLIPLVFGFRKWSFTNWIDGIVPLPVPMKNVMKLTGDLWQGGVARSKRNIVILHPAVLSANVISNNLILGVRGLSPEDIIKVQALGLSSVLKYQRDLRKRDKLQRLINIDKTSTKKQKAQKQIVVDRLTNELAANPVAPLVKFGFLQGIVEDISLTDDSFTKAVLNASPRSRALTDTIGPKIPQIVKDGYKQAIIAPDTEFGQVLADATKYSDFVARFALFQHLTKNQDVSIDAALNDISDTFVNYDVNTSQGLQYINDMGILMYTKFLLRIQRIIFRSFRDTPVTATALLAMQQATTNVPDIVDSNLITASVIDRVRVVGSSDTIDDAFTFNFFNYFGFMFPL